MTTFDLAEVQGFTARLETRINLCDNGKGLDCENLDQSLRLYANVCSEYREHVRQWARAIFTGKILLDREVENLWLKRGWQLYHRAKALFENGQERDRDCFILEGGSLLVAALSQLGELLFGWVSPKLAVSPAPRVRISVTRDGEKELIARIKSLPPLRNNSQKRDPSASWAG